MKNNKVIIIIVVLIAAIAAYFLLSGRKPTEGDISNGSSQDTAKMPNESTSEWILRMNQNGWNVFNTSILGGNTSMIKH